VDYSSQAGEKVRCPLFSAFSLPWSTHTWTRKHKGREYDILLFKLPSRGAEPGLAEKAAAQARVPPGPGVAVLAENEVNVGGHAGKLPVTRGGGATRVALLFGLGTRHLLNVVVSGDGSLDPKDPEVAAFLENITPNR
jgi:hypothetical protein